MLTIQYTDNPNYLAKIIKLPELRLHPNADRLSIVTCQGQNIITSNSSISGELYVLFQLESRLNYEFLSFINGFSDSEHNKDKTKKGFFSHKNLRVRAQKLRGVLSEGYLHPVSEVNEWLKEKGVKFQISDKDENTEFDTIANIKFVEKFITAQTYNKIETTKKNIKVAKETKILEGQFSFSPDYKHLKREMYNINPDDWIEISSKWHGCFGSISKLLTKRKLSIIEKVAQKFGAKIKDSEYNYVFASRRCLKSTELKTEKFNNFYDYNVWEIIGKRYSGSIKDGISISGEIVGYTPSGAPIQSMNGKSYDYGCEIGKCEFYVFRINYTSPSGNIYEFSLQQVIDYCNKYGLKHVPVFYIGKAKDKYPELDTENHWHKNFLNKLIEEYLEKECKYCNNRGLPDEGIIISKRVGKFEALKLKSQKFILGESAQLDKDEINIDDEN